MSLPDWNAEGLLPTGIHSGTLDDIRERFVEDAPERHRRELIYDTFVAYFRLLRSFVPSGRLWLDGGFGTQKLAAPHDVDVVIHPSDWAALESLDEQSQNDFLGMLTHQDVIVGSFDPPAYFERIQPIGGILDSFLCYPGQEVIWANTWASVKGDDGLIVPGATKGFVEVTW